MDGQTKLFRKLLDFFSLKVIGPIKFDRIVFLFTGKYFNLTAEDRTQIENFMDGGKYIWLSRRKTHFTTYLISLADYGLGLLKWCYAGYPFPKLNMQRYTHAFYNIDSDRFIEAIGKGVVMNLFDDVMNCDWVCALRVRGIGDYQWQQVADKMGAHACEHLGLPYDTVFNLNSSKELSCVELIRLILQESFGVNYDIVFKDLEAEIKKKGNLTPHMIRESPAFEVMLEIKR